MNTENHNIQKGERAQREEEILSFWQEKNIFQKTLEKDSPEGEYTFYEGPPTANGKPGIHHLEARAFKDAIPRYKTMRGYHVRRKGGWDTHGLPVELQVEKELGLTSKKEVEGYGVAAFNKKCKESVWTYLDIWNKFTHRIGYWVDQENPYVTYHNSYIESVWNVVGEINKQNLLYKDYKVVPWCPRCGTALSSHELAQGYQDVKDLSVYAKFKLTSGQKVGDFEVGENTYILAWTTTPWTLPGNVALAVRLDIKYVQVSLKETGESLILAEALTQKVLGEKEYTIEQSFSGKHLEGYMYEPLYPYLKQAIENDSAYDKNRDKAFKVYGADFVTTTDGTGVVHTAVMYGQDDFELGTKLDLPKYHTVDITGNFILGTDFLSGRFVKDEQVAIDVIKDLANREGGSLLFHKEKYEHSYPHCWRCKTPLIYYARDSWYINMSSLRDELVAENQSINWEPAYIRDGRFGEWLKDIKDWAISRERYWGTPLPIWVKQDGTRVVVDSIDTLKKHTRKSENTYLVMRHGEATHNLTWSVSVNPDTPNHLTDTGIEQVQHASTHELLQGLDLIIMSPFVRAVETAEIIKNKLGLTDEQVVVDERLAEFSVPSFEGQTWQDYHNVFPKTADYFESKKDGDESYLDVKKRVMDLVYDCEKKYSGKKIIFVTHGAPAWLMLSGAEGLTPKETFLRVSETDKYNEVKNASISLVPFTPLPHNENYELDLHKPYIDDVLLIDEQGQKMTRVKEVMDVWFDSGCMPYAQDHYPFENKEVSYPADFICEAIDQTRGWFYTLHAVGILLGRGKAYKNVICLGHILDAEGKKMSKSLGNIVDPWLMMEKYGVDPLRFFMYTVNQPGESKNFDEKTVLEMSRKVFTLLDNVYTFYDLYRDKNLETNEIPSSSHVLDKWIFAKLADLTLLMTKNLDEYKLLEPGRSLREFVDELSTWYLRRSRERLKEGDAEAKRTLYFVLKTLSKLFAPLTPFMAEDLYQKLKCSGDQESVHLESWPVCTLDDSSLIIGNMSKVKDLVSLGLQARQKEGVAVRQPLQKITFLSATLLPVYVEIIKDELNIKEVAFDENLTSQVELDVVLTSELKKEGVAREFIRAVQDMRKKKGLSPDDQINLTVHTSDEGQALLTTYGAEIQKTVGATDMVFGHMEGEEVLLGEVLFIINF